MHAWVKKKDLPAPRSCHPPTLPLALSLGSHSCCDRKGWKEKPPSLDVRGKIWKVVVGSPTKVRIVVTLRSCGPCVLWIVYIYTHIYVWVSWGGATTCNAIILRQVFRQNFFTFASHIFHFMELMFDALMDKDILMDKGKPENYWNVQGFLSV